MNVELPEFAVVEDRPCDCGCTTFVNFFVRGPNIGGKCRDCAKEKRWFSKFDLGLARGRNRKGSKDRSEMLARWGNRCAWCGISAIALQEHGEELVEGHIVPYHTLHTLPDIQNHECNRVPSCNACNDWAHKIGKDERLFSLAILMHAAVCWAAGKLGEHANERGGKTSHNNPGAIRSALRSPGLGGVPVPGERQAPLSGKGPARGDDG